MLAYVSLVGVAVVLAAHQLSVGLTTAYLEPLGGSWVALAVGAGSSCLAVCIAIGRRLGAWALPAGLTVGALVSVTSGPLAFMAFDRGLGLVPVIGVMVVLAHAALGFAVGRASRSVLPTALRLGLVPWALSPFRLLAAAVGVGLVTAALGTIGPWRASAAASALLAVSALWSPRVATFLALSSARQPPGLTALGATALGLAFASFGAAELVVPLGMIGHHPNTIVHRSRGAHHEFVVTSGQRAFELHVDGRLRVSSLDQARYFGALVHPALASAPDGATVLLLGGGTGIAEHEVLSHTGVRSLTSVVSDSELLRVARRQRWLVALNGGALDSDRLTLVEEEPSVFLQRNQSRFDVVLADFPDPLSHADGKYYSVHLLGLVARALSPSGVLVVQAMSPFTSPESFATVAATLAHVGLASTAYRAGVPSFGDWGFLAARRGAAPELDLARAAERLSGVTALELRAFPRDSHYPAAATPSTLYDGHLVEVFEAER